MKNRVALITGGSGDIGTEIARYFFEQGALVAISYNKRGRHELAEEWRKQQKSEGYDFEMFYADISDFDAAAHMVANVEKKFGKIDVLVNNAGVTADSTLRKMLPEQWANVINSNLNSIFNVTRNVITGMLDREYGRIVNISSINGQKGQIGQTNYSASKAGIHGFTKALAQEVARKNITVNTVSPGYVNTKMMNDVPKEILDKIVATIPMGRLAESREVARLVAFLSSQDSAYITGANLAINGGQHMY